MKLVWGEGLRLFDQGVDRGVLYLDGVGVPWNGLVSVDENPSGEVNTEHYYDGVRLQVTQLTGDFGAVISAYTYPDVFAEYNGYSEREIYQRFGFSYRTQSGNGHKLHIVYNALINDSARAWKSLGADVDPSLFQWGISGTAVPIPGASPAARLTMEVDANLPILEAIEDILYGTDETDARLPDPSELYELYESMAIFRITYNGDGSFTATGPDDMVTVLEDGRFELNSPSVFVDDDGKYTAVSYY